MTDPTTERIRRSYSGERAHRHVTAISQHHRIQASPGYRAAARYVAGELEAAGVRVQIRRYPADGRARFWTTPSFLEWACDDASLLLLDERSRPAETMCDFAALPISLIQRSIPMEGEFEVVAPGGKGGKEAADYDGLDVAGKIVLTREMVGRVAELAIRQRGAAGILFDGMAAGGRTELDLPDARQYTSFWWGGTTTPDAWGFVLSPRQGRTMRARLAEGKPVRVRASIHSRFYAGTFEVVDGLIPGTDPDAGEILLVSHLCHPLPGAHDNASGAAALIEAAATLARLVAAAALAQPRRGIRFLWPPEMTGTFAWLAGQMSGDQDAGGGRAQRWIAGLNLDMVGADQEQTRGTWELVRLPAAGASFADHLLSWLARPFLDGIRHRETPFSAGSDHYILSDPSVGIPSPMLIHWPDRFYHTSADTADKVSPDSLARSGALAATYAAWLGAAGPAEAAWLGSWMVRRFATQAGVEAAAAAETCRITSDPRECGRTWSRYRRGSRFRADRMAAALGDLGRIADGMDDRIAALRGEVSAIAAREDAWVRSVLGPEEPAAAAADEPWRAAAASLVPRRRLPGPIDAGMAIQADARHLQPACWQLSDDGGPALYDSASLMQYWADGRRSVAEIADLVEIETGKPAGELALRYFELLAEAGLVTT